MSSVSRQIVNRVRTKACQQSPVLDDIGSSLDVKRKVRREVSSIVSELIMSLSEEIWDVTWERAWDDRHSAQDSIPKRRSKLDPHLP